MPGGPLGPQAPLPPLLAATPRLPAAGLQSGGRGILWGTTGGSQEGFGMWPSQRLIPQPQMQVPERRGYEEMSSEGQGEAAWAPFTLV